MAPVLSPLCRSRTGVAAFVVTAPTPAADSVVGVALADVCAARVVATAAAVEVAEDAADVDGDEVAVAVDRLKAIDDSCASVGEAVAAATADEAAEEASSAELTTAADVCAGCVGVVVRYCGNGV